MSMAEEVESTDEYTELYGIVVNSRTIHEVPDFYSSPPLFTVGAHGVSALAELVQELPSNLSVKLVHIPTSVFVGFLMDIKPGRTPEESTAQSRALMNSGDVDVLFDNHDDLSASAFLLKDVEKFTAEVEEAEKVWLAEGNQA